jgi:AcrR family transcriptional regulator
MDDFAAESGISRASLYRRFGSSEGIFQTLLQQQALPYIESSSRSAANARNLAERIEMNTVAAVMEVPEYPALKLFFEQVTSDNQLAIIRPVYQQLVKKSLIPQLEAARHAGEMRPELDLDEVAEWLLRSFILLVIDGPWEETRLRQHIRQFVLPVIVVDPRGDDTDSKLLLLETKLSTMAAQLTEITRLLHHLTPV